jgi:hypothetical protein
MEQISQNAYCVFARYFVLIDHVELGISRVTVFIAHSDFVLLESLCLLVDFILCFVIPENPLLVTKMQPVPPHLRVKTDFTS